MNILRHTAAALCCAGQLTAETLGCPDPLFEVKGSNGATREQTCKAATEARIQLQSCNVILKSKIEIEVVEAFESQFEACLGLYHCGENRIEILSPDAMSITRDRDGAFKLISDPAYWNSILVHELTHAVYDTVTCPFTDCVATSEYASYAMQVLLLPKDEQALFGQTVKVQSEPSSESISAVMLFIAPERFAKIAWLHFQSKDDSCDYMQRIMDGQVFFDQEPI